MIKRKNKLDEMQEQKLLKIEHNGYWFVFWGLFLSIIIQLVIGGENLIRNVAGEWIVFMALDIYMIVASLKNGIWDRRLSPNRKTNLALSLLAGTVSGILVFSMSYLGYRNLTVSIASGAITLITAFCLTLLVLSACVALYRKRVERLENTIDEKDNDEKNS